MGGGVFCFYQNIKNRVKTLRSLPRQSSLLPPVRRICNDHKDFSLEHGCPLILAFGHLGLLLLKAS